MDPLALLVLNAVEYRRFDELLDLFKPDIEASLIGNAKNIKMDRDRIAHRNPGVGAPAATDPITAYEIFNRIIELIRAYDSTAP